MQSHITYSSNAANTALEVVHPEIHIPQTQTQSTIRDTTLSYLIKKRKLINTRLHSNSTRNEWPDFGVFPLVSIKLIAREELIDSQ